MACGNDACDAHYHGYCFDMVKERAPCLECKTSFTETPPTPVGEKAVSREQDDWARPNKRRRSGRADEDEDEDGSEVGLSQERRAVREEDELESEEENRPVSSHTGTQLTKPRSLPQSQRPHPETVIPDSFIDPDEDDEGDAPGPSRRRRR